MATVERIINAESGGNRYTRNPRSTAYGPGQFLGSTWLNMISRYRPDLAQGRSRADLLELRSDPAISAEMTKRYSEENGRFLASHGYEPTDANLYLAHFAGPQGAVNLLANPDKSAAEVLGPRVIEANPYLANWKASDVAQWAGRKMGGPEPSPVAAMPTTAPIMATPRGAITDDILAQAQGSAAPQQKEPTAMLPFLASLFGGGAGAAAGLGSSLGQSMAGSGGLLSPLFGEGGFDFGKMMNDTGQPDPANPLVANPAQPQVGMMPRPQVNMQGLQAMLANRPVLGGGPNILRG
jgi:hypothetical protein